MFSFEIYPEDVLRTDAAAYPCGVCPPEYPCYDVPPPDSESF